jgi:hypothetical protein
MRDGLAEGDFDLVLRGLWGRSAAVGQHRSLVEGEVSGGDGSIAARLNS